MQRHYWPAAEKDICTQRFFFLFGMRSKVGNYHYSSNHTAITYHNGLNTIIILLTSYTMRWHTKEKCSTFLDTIVQDSTT